MPQIVSYRITYMSSSDHAWKAEIRCYGTSQGSDAVVALIRFFEEGVAIPADGWANNVVNGVPIVNYALARFADVVTILRDENYASVNTFSYSSGGQNVKAWGVSTGAETTGDMEP
jgi:hypothetical protein